MNVEKIELDKDRARELYDEYKAHQQYSDPLDRLIQRAYHAIAKGGVVIKALESIRLAGLGTDGYPKLAIGNAAAERCFLDMSHSGGALMSRSQRPSSLDQANTFRFPEGTFPPRTGYSKYGLAAITPMIPVHLRPKKALESYHILWEAEWTRIPPRDPYLLRRIGGDMWLVVAAWDLTEVERAAMATRISS